MAIGELKKLLKWIDCVSVCTCLWSLFNPSIYSWGVFFLNWRAEQRCSPCRDAVIVWSYDADSTKQWRNYLLHRHFGNTSIRHWMALQRYKVEAEDAVIKSFGKDSWKRLEKVFLKWCMNCGSLQNMLLSGKATVSKCLLASESQVI